jgi:VWFA-related protein
MVVTDMLSNLRLGGLLGLAVIGLSAARAQAPAAAGSASQPATIKSEVRIVLVDLVVTRDKGEPVAGLRKEDFEVLEDGKAQMVSFFEEHQEQAYAPVQLPAMPPNVFTNYPVASTGDSVNVLLLDSLNTQAVDQAFVREQLIQYLAKTQPGARLAIFTLGSRLRMVRGISVDPTEFSAAVGDRQSGVNPQVMPQLPTPVQVDTDATLTEGMRSPESIAAVKQFLSDESGRYTGERIQITLNAFQQLARFLSPIPGRKNLMWFSGSFPISFFPNTGVRGTYPEQFQGDVKRTANLLTADQVAVYPIGARGLTGDALYGAEYIVSPSMQSELLNNESGERAANQIAMELLAQDTGGKAFYNTNGLGEALTAAIRDGSNYYTLAYAPSDARRDGRYRRIQVKALSGDYRLAYRRGYYAEKGRTEFAAGRKSDPLAPLVRFGMPDFSQILYKVQVQPLKVQPEANALHAVGNTDLKGPTVRYGLDFAVAAQDLTFQKAADGIRRASIDVVVIGYDRDGKALNLARKKNEVAVDAGEFAQLLKVGLQVHGEIDLPAGDIFLRTGVYDSDSGRVGTLGIGVSGVVARPK